MKNTVSQSGEPGELDLLLTAVSDALEALIAWDIEAFQDATRRQQLVCSHLGSGALQLNASDPIVQQKARTIRELNQRYARLLHHSIQWTRTLQNILQTGGHDLANRTTLHLQA